MFFCALNLIKATIVIGSFIGSCLIKDVHTLSETEVEAESG